MQSNEFSYCSNIAHFFSLWYYLSMIETPFCRTEMLLGSENLMKLNTSHVAVFGLGGVGSYATEALARSGIGSLDIIDNDVVSISNLNRQLYALNSTIGKAKVDIAQERILDINPNCKITKHKVFFLPQTAMSFDFSKYDYVVDCIDTVSAKLQLIQMAKEKNVPVISCMGTGNKQNPSLFEITDIEKTSVCPLARVMRQELKARNIHNVKVLFSKEPPCIPATKDGGRYLSEAGKPIPASISFCPSVAGLLIASEVIKDLCKK